MLEPMKKSTWDLHHMCKQTDTGDAKLQEDGTRTASQRQHDSSEQTQPLGVDRSDVNRCIYRILTGL